MDQARAGIARSVATRAPARPLRPRAQTPSSADHHRAGGAALVQQDRAAARLSAHPPGRRRRERVSEPCRRISVDGEHDRRGDVAVAVDDQDLGGPELAHEQRVAVDHDVPQVARQLQRPRGGPAGRRERDQLAPHAGHVHEIGRRIVSHPARDRTGRSARQDRPRDRIDRHQRAPAAEDDVNVPGGVGDQSARLVVRLERDAGRHRVGREVGDRNRVAVGIGGHRRDAVGKDRQRSAADGRRRIGGRHGGVEVRGVERHAPGEEPRVGGRSTASASPPRDSSRRSRRMRPRGRRPAP